MKERGRKGVKINNDNTDIYWFWNGQMPLFFVRLTLEKSSLENVIGWSNSKLVWKKRNNGTLWLSKKVETKYNVFFTGKIIIVESQASRSLEITLKQISVVITHLEDAQEKLNKSFAFFSLQDWWNRNCSICVVKWNHPHGCGSKT